MSQLLLSTAEVNGKIAAGGRLLLAGEERLLRQLSPGSWIGGTIPYFMGPAGGVFSEEQIFATELPDYCSGTAIETLDAVALRQIFSRSASNGFSFVIIPGMSATHLSFALEAPGYPGFASHPLIGWIAGTNLERLGTDRPKVMDGRSGQAHEDAAVVMHVTLPSTKVADVRILNIFEPGAGEAIHFPKTGFEVRHALVGGGTVDFADYVVARGLDTRLPLVADYAGARINTSFQKVERDAHRVTFYAPVFEGVAYRPARPVEDYVRLFLDRVPAEMDGEVLFSCNCILNYLYSELKGKRTGPFVGPITFGEVAYQLVNQTLAYLVVTDAR